LGRVPNPLRQRDPVRSLPRYSHRLAQPQPERPRDVQASSEARRIAYRLDTGAKKGATSDQELLGFVRNRILADNKGAIPAEAEVRAALDARAPGWQPTDLFPEYRDNEPKGHSLPSGWYPAKAIETATA